MNTLNIRGSLMLVLGFLMTCSSIFAQNILVFSKTAGFRHSSISAGKAALEKMAKEKGFVVKFTENSDEFTQKNLSQYRAVIFLNTTGDILNAQQQDAFERFIQAGGGYVGVHAATDTEYDWPWYNRLAGAWFLDHPNPDNVQKGRFYVTERNSLTVGMPDDFVRSDEFYSFKNISPDIKVVLKIDEKSYRGGNNGENHPMSWYQEFDGGRAFYTAMGHTEESYSEPLFLNHLYAGIQYVTGGAVTLDWSKSRPEENRFSKVVLAEKLDEPMELTLLDAERILFIQRKGEVRLYNTRTKELKTIAQIPVSIHYVNAEGKESMAEDGLLGLNKDPNFAKNQWIYMYYSSTKGSFNVLSRFTMKGSELLLNSEKEMLRIPTQREECCHTGGSIEWDKAGNLYLSTGDNTNPHGSNGYSPSDERPGRSAWDAQKSSANTNDLRGKIIRIKPQANGTYTIPQGNLFPKGTPNTRPEIYTMGHRNPFRISIDQHTGYLYWGEVGPDANKPDSLRGPAGHDEVGQAKGPGNYGWPHFVGDNKAYNRYDFVNSKSLEKWNAKAPVNTSPNNTGLEILPPAQKAFIWYPYDISPEFPLVGTGGRNAMAGPIFYSADFKNSARAFPKYYDGKFFAYDWMRGWIMAISMNKNGDLASMERFMPSYKFSNPMDMVFANNGDLYMLEYGTGWFVANDDARLVKIEYNGGNRKPLIKASSDKKGGAVPLVLNLSSTGTTDADGDDLKYTWKITSSNGYFRTINKPEAQLNLTKPGDYMAVLTVNDGKGGISTETLELIVGNESPKISFELQGGNKSFFVPNKRINYKVNVKDLEDGELGKGISADAVAVNIDFLADGYDKNIISAGHRSADASASFAKGKKLIDASDCMACHQKSTASIGPSYLAIAKKYKDDKNALNYLSKKVINGGAGAWGEVPMAAHPQISNADAGEMVKYIMSLAASTPKGLPVKGSFETKVPNTDKGQGVYLLRASYADQGAPNLSSLRAVEDIVLRNTRMDAHGMDEYFEMTKMAFSGRNLAIATKSGAYTMLKQIDLGGIKEIQVQALALKTPINTAGGKIQVRLDGLNGAIIGESKQLSPTEKQGLDPTTLSIPITLPSAFDQKLHDIFIVFDNPNAGSASLMIVLGFEFKLTDEGVAVSTEPSRNNTPTDYFVGDWEMVFLGTPSGDMNVKMHFERKNGLLTGGITAENNTISFEKIEEKGADSIIVYFNGNGMDINVEMNKKDDDSVTGKLLGMLEVQGKRLKK